MNFRTYEDLSKIISNNLYKIPNDVDLIVGVPKSGLIAANMISLHLNLPLTDIDSLLEDKIYNSGITKKRENWVTKPEDARRILIVDDSSASGDALKQVMKKICNSKYKDKIIYLVIFVTNQTKDLPDMYFDLCPLPRMFEWNYMHHELLKQACVDIDGVLCQDPTDEENDDGQKYIEFISNVKPRVIPTKKIKYLVTTRLEKYRKYTEKWLSKNNIKYEKLIMMDLPSKEERIRLGNHGNYKGEQYKVLPDAIIFIESNEHQAQIIANVSGKDVFCVDNSKIYKPQIIEQPIQKEKILRRVFRKVIPLKIRKFLRDNIIYK